MLCLQISIIKTANSIITAANEKHFARAYFDCFFAGDTISVTPGFLLVYHNSFLHLTKLWQ